MDRLVGLTSKIRMPPTRKKPLNVNTDACPTAPLVDSPHCGMVRLSGSSCKAQPVVGDWDGDGMPEVVVNAVPLFQSIGKLHVLDGRTAPQNGNAMHRWATPMPPQLVTSMAMISRHRDRKEYENSLLAAGSYSVVLYSAMAKQWESDNCRQ